MPLVATSEDASTRIHAVAPIRGTELTEDERLNGLTRLARRHFGAAIAAVALIEADRKWLGACNGYVLHETPLTLSLLCHAAVANAIVIVTDASVDERFQHHPLVIDNPCIRFYAACPLVSSSGDIVGAFCLLDDEPGTLDDAQRECLRDLASLAAAIVERDRVQAALRAEDDALRNRERRMALAIEGSGTGIWDRNVVTGEIYYSAAWKAMLGYEEHELTSRITDSYTRVHPDELAYVQATIQAHFDQKTESYEVEHRLRCKDGSYKWVVSRGKVVSRDANGKPLRMSGTTTDITAMRTLSETVRQTADLITNLTNEVPGLVFQYHRLPDGKSFFSYASAGIGEIYEITPAQVATNAAAIHAAIHPDDLPAYLASLEISAANLSPWHLEYRVHLPRQGLRWRQGDAQPRRLEDGSTVWHGFITDVTERKRIEAELQELATIDSLTQLPNRRHFLQQAEAELARIQRDLDHAAVLMWDLDHFKSINDRWGHAIGDMALLHFANIVRDALRKTDIAGRVGGEEFAVLLRGAVISDALAFAQHVQARIAETPLCVPSTGHAIPLTVSVGIAAMRANDANASASLSRSDIALYRAKNGGRNRIECE